MNPKNLTNNVNANSQNWRPILSIYIALKPLYLSRSGSLQICDIFMALGLVYILFTARGKIILPGCAKSFTKVLLAFLLFVCMINGLWTLTGYSYLKPILYYIFNFLAVMLCLCIYQRNGKLAYEQAVFNGIFLSAIIALLGLIVIGKAGRATGFFNNPNQLGYYGVVIVSFVLLFVQPRWTIRKVFIFLAGIVCIVLSLSKAAFIALLVQCVLYVISIGKKASIQTLTKRILLVIVLGTIFYLFLFTDILSGSVFDPLIHMRNRLLSMVNENDSDFGSGRGYDRILELGIHFLWGKGEGNYSRFISLTGAEVHSTYGSLIVSYGVIGFLLYVSFVIKAIWKKNNLFSNIVILSGVLLYSLTHNGIRNTLVWILLATIYLHNVESD